MRENRSVAIGGVLLLVLLVAGGLIVSGFLSVQNARSILLLAAFLGLASTGQTLVALLGGLDLSIPFLIGSANILLPKLMHDGVSPPLAIVIVLVLGIVAGCANGFASYKLQGQSLIMSLGVGSAVQGATEIAVDGRSTLPAPSYRVVSASPVSRAPRTSLEQRYSCSLPSRARARRADSREL
jgi:ribose transport system permease protein